MFLPKESKGKPWSYDHFDANYVLYTSLDSAIQQAIYASLAGLHTSILQKVITLSALRLKWHLNSSSSITCKLIFVFSITPPFWFRTSPQSLYSSLEIRWTIFPGLYCNFSACGLRYAWQNAYFQMIASYFCCLRRYSIAIYLPALHSSIIQRDLGLKSKCRTTQFCRCF